MHTSIVYLGDPLCTLTGSRSCCPIRVLLYGIWMHSARRLKKKKNRRTSCRRRLDTIHEFLTRRRHHHHAPPCDDLNHHDCLYHVMRPPLAAPCDRRPAGHQVRRRESGRSAGPAPRGALLQGGCQGRLRLRYVLRCDANGQEKVRNVKKTWPYSFYTLVHRGYRISWTHRLI